MQQKKFKLKIKKIDFITWGKSVSQAVVIPSHVAITTTFTNLKKKD